MPAATAAPSTSAAAATNPSTFEVPRFSITAVRGNVVPPSTGTVAEFLSSLGSDAIELAYSYNIPSEACSYLYELQGLSRLLVKPPIDAASASVIAAADTALASRAAGYSLSGITEIRLVKLMDDEKLLSMLQQLPLSMIRWPQHLFGLSTIPVLTWLEGQEAVEHCTGYKFIQVCSFLAPYRAVVAFGWPVQKLSCWRCSDSTACSASKC
jgi:hypothetical protein